MASVKDAIDTMVRNIEGKTRKRQTGGHAERSGQRFTVKDEGIRNCATAGVLV